MVDKLKQDECYKALQCLYIAIDGAVANDVNYKVKAYLMELESRVKELEAELSTLRADNERLREALDKIANSGPVGAVPYFEGQVLSRWNHCVRIANKELGGGA